MSSVNWVYSIRNLLDDWGFPKWCVDRFSLKAIVALSTFTVWDSILNSFQDADGFTYNFGAHFITNCLVAAVGVSAICRHMPRYELAPSVGNKFTSRLPQTMLFHAAARFTGRTVAVGYSSSVPESPHVWHVCRSATLRKRQ